MIFPLNFFGAENRAEIKEEVVRSHDGESAVHFLNLDEALKLKFVKVIAQDLRANRRLPFDRFLPPKSLFSRSALIWNKAGRF